MSTLQKTNLAPGTIRRFTSSHYLHITQNTMVLFFSLYAWPRRPQILCAIEEALTLPIEWLMLSYQQATKSSTKERLKSILLHLNTTQRGQITLSLSPASCFSGQYAQPSRTTKALLIQSLDLFAGLLMSLKLGWINCFLCLWGIVNQTLLKHHASFQVISLKNTSHKLPHLHPCQVHVSLHL